MAGGHLFIQGTKVIGNYKLKVNHGEYILITAVANPRYTFKKWDAEYGVIDLPSLSSASVRITSNAKITALFESNEKVNLTLQSKPENAGWFFGQGNHAPNQSHPLFTRARNGYEFVRWEGASSIADPYSPSTNFNLLENTTIFAVFKSTNEEVPPLQAAAPGIHMLTLKTNNSKAGIVIGSGVFGTGWVDISCESKDGYIFRQWEGDSIQDIYSSSTKVFLTQDLLVTAKFDSLINAPSVPQSVIPNSESLGAGWLASHWFGSYWRKTDDHWVLHSKLGWIYLIPYSNDSIWFWSDKVSDWLWTNKSVFPYILKASSSKWLWLDEINSNVNSQLFFEFYDSDGNGKWHAF